MNRYAAAAPRWLACALTLVAICASNAAAEAELKLELLEPRVPCYGRAEFQITGLPSYQNPFDPDEVDLTLRITAPNGQQQVLPAFWAQLYERRKTGAGGRSQDWLYPNGWPGWHARFAPAEPGRYRVALMCETDKAAGPLPR